MRAWVQGPSRWITSIAPVLWTLVAAGGIGLVAYTDSQVTSNLSVGYLYLFPLVLAGVTIRHRGTLLSLVVVSAMLREWFGLFEHSGWPLVVRNIVVPLTFAAVVLVVSRAQARRRQLADVVSQQRDQLTRDLEEAGVLQRHLIPDQMPDVPGFDLSSHLYPARFVAGDFYDVVWNETDGELAITVADIAGKGTAAAMLMPVVQATVRRLRSVGASPAQLAARLNDVISGLMERPRLVSLVYLVLYRHTGDIDYVNIGHPPPVVTTGVSESHWRWLNQGGPIAGAVPGASYETGRERLNVGDTLLLYTDGASEAENEQGAPFSEDRLARVVSQHRELSAAHTIEALHAEIEAFRADRSNRDDVTLVVVRRRVGHVEPDDGRSQIAGSEDSGA